MDLVGHGIKKDGNVGILPLFMFQTIKKRMLI